MAEKRETAPSRIDGRCETSTVKNTTFNLVWDIKDYKTVKDNHPKGKYLESQQFAVKVNDKNVNFWLVLYPNGENVENIFLHLESDDAPENSENVKVKPVYSIIDSSGNTYDIGKGKELGLPYGTGFYNFVKDDELFGPESTLLKEGTLTFLCEITIKSGDVVCKKIKETKLVEEDTSHCEDMMRMLMNAKEHHADIEIKCKDGIIPAHSSVLSARSEVFKVNTTL